MLSKNLKKSAILCAILIILLKGLADIYYFQSSSSIFYILISTLLLVVITLVIMFPVARTETINYWKENKILTNLSHEFRTPMIGIIGAADLLERENLTSSQFDHLENIKQAGFSLLNIIDNVLDLSKLELGQVDIDLTSSSCKKIINSCAFEVSSSLKAKGLNLNIDFAENANTIVMLDELKYKQIILILLNKAIQNADSGTIHLQVLLKKSAWSDNRLFLSIAYKGTYVKAPEKNPLSSGDNHSSAGESNGGLGLYFCQQLVKYLGGKLCTVRQSERSIVFQLDLPVEIIAAAENHQQEEDLKNLVVTSFKRLKVLLVEDNAFNIKILSQMLDNYGFEVSTAENGLQCLQILQEDSFDVILMDMLMPIMDGYEASRIIRNDPDLRFIPIIAVTANAMIGDREKCLASGCTSYLAKPFLARELIQEIEKVMQEKKILRIAADSKQDHTVLYKKEFISELERCIPLLEDACAKNDWESVKSLCQEIKSLGGLYSCKEVYHQASLIESAAGKKMIKIVRLTLIELKKHVNTLNCSDYNTSASLK